MMLLFPTLLITTLATASSWRLSFTEVAPVAFLDHARFERDRPDHDRSDYAPLGGAGFEHALDRAGLEHALLDQDALSSIATLSGVRGCTTLRGGLVSHWALPCSPLPLEPLLARWSLGWRGFSAPSHRVPSGTAPASGGFLHLDLIVAHNFGAGPEVAWIMPEAPHEDLLKQRLVTPGVGVWYSALASHLFLGVSANTWISTLGEAWFVNALSSEARVGLTL
jgi:hypothetical protein